MNKSESKYFNTAVKMDLALISLLEQKPFEYITVSELCKTAGVNRSTFYLHYETFDDLLAETTRYLLDDFLSYFSVDRKAALHDLARQNLQDLNFIEEEYLLPYLTYIKDHKALFKTALSHTKTLGFDDVYKRMFENIFSPILSRFHYPAADQKYVMMYYLSGINAIILTWLQDNCDRSCQEISQVISTCIFGLNNQFLPEKPA